jgi:hypothetical protein
MNVNRFIKGFFILFVSFLIGVTLDRSFEHEFVATYWAIGFFSGLIAGRI